MLRIELVNVAGMLVGRTVSDRWNLDTLGAAALYESRNQADVKRLRRIAQPLGILITVVRSAECRIDPTPAESEALRPVPTPAAPGAYAMRPRPVVVAWTPFNVALLARLTHRARTQRQAAGAHYVADGRPDQWARYLVRCRRESALSATLARVS